MGDGEKRLNMESDEKRPDTMAEKAGPARATMKHDEIKKYHPSRGGWRAEKGARKGRNSEIPRGPTRGPAGPSPQGVSHARGNTLDRKTNIGADK